VSAWFSQQGFKNVVVCNIGAQGFGVRGDRVDVRPEELQTVMAADVAKSPERRSSLAASAAAPN